VTRLTATEVARNFSDVLNRVATGEEIEVIRRGAPVAVIARFRELMASAPPVDDDFAEDLRQIRRESGSAPENPWPSGSTRAC